METSKVIAQKLLEIKAVSLSPNKPYTWASGIKSPIYCDNRLTNSYVDVRNLITEAFVDLIKTKFNDIDAIVGTATAGIPQAAYISEALALPMAYVRNKAKGHGKQSQIEGYLKPKSKVIVIEDLISTGGSSIQAVKALEDNDIEVAAVISIFTYEMPQAIKNFDTANIKFHSLSNYTTLIKEALKLEYINEVDLDSLYKWQKDPESYKGN